MTKQWQPKYGLLAEHENGALRIVVQQWINQMGKCVLEMGVTVSGHDIGTRVLNLPDNVRVCTLEDTQPNDNV